jgi:hypothetical protein
MRREGLLLFLFFIHGIAKEASASEPAVPAHYNYISKEKPHSSSPKSQSFYQRYGPNLPTSLTYILPIG